MKPLLSEIEQELALQWEELQEKSCSCHINPPCSHCSSGGNLELDEYIKLYWPEDVPTEDPDAAMLARDEAQEELAPAITQEPKEQPWYSRMAAMDAKLRV